MKTVKPIVVIYVPQELVLSNGGRLATPMELMGALNGSFGEPDGRMQYTDYWKDYYWFCFYDYEIQTPRFEVFHEKDFTEIQYAELKKIIEDAIEKQKSIRE